MAGMPTTLGKTMRNRDRGFCDECKYHAAFLQSECPYLDMTRGDRECEVTTVLP
jgi:hypothetical protein